jgi:hypothetical protein
MGNIFINNERITRDGLVLSQLPDFLNSAPQEMSVPTNTIAGGGFFSYKARQPKVMNLFFHTSGDNQRLAQDKVMYLQSLVDSEQEFELLIREECGFDRRYTVIAQDLRVDVNHYNINTYQNIVLSVLVPRGFGELYEVNGGRVQTVKNTTGITASVSDLGIISPLEGYKYSGLIELSFLGANAEGVSIKSTKDSVERIITLGNVSLNKKVTLDFLTRKVMIDNIPASAMIPFFSSGDMSKFIQRGAVYSLTFTTPSGTANHTLKFTLFSLC